MNFEDRKRFQVLLAVILCLPFIFLFTRGPSPGAEGDCLTQVTIFNAAHFTHVCDS